MARNAGSAVALLFDLLGIEFAKEGDKATEFSKHFKTLGVEEFEQGAVYIGHTEERKQELGSVLQDLLVEKRVSSKQAESLRGRMQWFESFAFGRVANKAVQTLGQLALKRRKANGLSTEELRDLKFLRDRVLQAPPLKISRSCLTSWIVFTDGACEGSDRKVGSVGGVPVSPSGTCVEFFGCLVF